MPARKIIRDSRYQKRKDMGAHVPAVGQQGHRMRHQTDSDLDDHHRGGNPDHDAGAPFRMGEIRNEIVSLRETGMIGPPLHVDSK